VLDEADEMLNVGFKEHVDKIFAQVVKLVVKLVVKH
jgi:superfamily II DNA/RNA helicase